MKKIFCVFYLVAFVVLSSFASIKNTDEFQQRELIECTPRGGLANFFRKMEQGKDVKIAYFGGSITAQSGWRVQSLEYFQKLFPKAKISEINAAIGGTGSDLGAFRLENDVLKFKPDLVFIEFAVNDVGTSPSNIRKSMEGIVRHIWSTNKLVDICFVYTVTAGNEKELLNQKMSRSASVMEEIADYYKIPSIHFAKEIAELVKNKKLIFKTDSKPMERVSGNELNTQSKAALDADGKIPFAKDGVHPYTDTGHILYTNAIKRSMPFIKKASLLRPRVIPNKSYVENNWANTKAVSIGSDYVKTTGKKLDFQKDNFIKHFTGKTESFYELEPNDSLEFKFKGTKVLIYDLLSHRGGTVEVILDGKRSESVRIDGYCTYQRLALLSIGDNLEDKIHTVKIKVLDKDIDKSKILFKQNLTDMEKNPNKYAPKNFYPAAIFIVGEMVK